MIEFACRTSRDLTREIAEHRNNLRRLELLCGRKDDSASAGSATDAAGAGECHELSLSDREWTAEENARLPSVDRSVDGSVDGSVGSVMRHAKLAPDASCNLVS